MARADVSIYCKAVQCPNIDFITGFQKTNYTYTALGDTPTSGNVDHIHAATLDWHSDFFTCKLLIVGPDDQPESQY